MIRQTPAAQKVAEPKAKQLLKTVHGMVDSSLLFQTTQKEERKFKRSSNRIVARDAGSHSSRESLTQSEDEYAGDIQYSAVLALLCLLRKLTRQLNEETKIKICMLTRQYLQALLQPWVGTKVENMLSDIEDRGPNTNQE